ncbi:MAG: hypothetical protein EOO77_31930, partial [Oxalobacteraceae bacterium]
MRRRHAIARLLLQIEEYALYFFLLGIGTFIASFCEVALAMYSAERQGQRMRLSYMKAILRQDMEWYDTNNPGEAATRMAEDTVVVLGGIGEKLTNTIHYAVTFITGMLLAAFPRMHPHACARLCTRARARAQARTGV